MTTCHLFCRVIDNYGDLGVCWRLARHLADSHGVSVTLFVDDLASFTHLAPVLNPELATQSLGDISVHHWRSDQPLPAPADLVIEAFACDLPAEYLAAMASSPRPPAWINLEYLSAEDWVAGCHGLDSVHPQLGLLKTFWFPGVEARTGGLLRSAEELAIMQEAADSPAAFLAGLPAAACNGMPQISLFGYEQPALSGLLDALAADSTPRCLNVFQGRALSDVEQWLGQRLLPGVAARRGALSLRLLPLLPHADYDRLLAICELNLVRGEDSFVRAQWAGQAMLWHIYPQNDDAHLVKLQAWQQRVEDAALAASTPMPAIWSERLQAWNRPDAARKPASEKAWQTFLQALPDIRAGLRAWRSCLLAEDDLASQLMRFYTNRVESRPT